MTSYRDLRPDELEALRNEFVQYLSANGISGDQWKKWLDARSGETDLHISRFSGIVWEKVLATLAIVERVEDRSIHLVRFGTDKAMLIGLELPAGLSAEAWMSDPKILTMANDNIRAFHVIKTYDKSRSQEIYFLLEQGYQPSSLSELYDLLAAQLGLALP